MDGNCTLKEITENVSQFTKRQLGPTPVDKRHSDMQIILPPEFICMRLAFDNAGEGENGLLRGGA